MNEDDCPKCGEPFDQDEYELVECVTCGIFGCTKNCIQGGKLTECLTCEEENMGDLDYD